VGRRVQPAPRGRALVRRGVPRPPEYGPESPAGDRPGYHERRGARAPQRRALSLRLACPLDDPLVRAAAPAALPQPETARAGPPALGPGRRAAGAPVPPRRADQTGAAGRWARPAARDRGLAREPLLPDAPGRVLRVLAGPRPPPSVAGASGARRRRRPRVTEGRGNLRGNSRGGGKGGGEARLSSLERFW